MNATTENTITPPFIRLPHNGNRCFDPMNRGHIEGLAIRLAGKAKRSAKLWELANDSTVPANDRDEFEVEHHALMVEIEETLTPIGIVTDWPGLYPSFTVSRRPEGTPKGVALPAPKTGEGFGEYTVEAAILSALGLPRNFLTA